METAVAKPPVLGTVGVPAPGAEPLPGASLRSLGLRPGGKRVGPSDRSDRQRGLSSRRDTRPPAEYAVTWAKLTQ